MDILVVSDTHGRTDRLEAVLERTRADMVFFLGDGLRDLHAIPTQLTVRAVRGNCDFFGRENTPEVRVETVGAYRFFLTHGHRYEVKRGITVAVQAAALADADVLLYGHTHRPHIAYLAADSAVGSVVLKKPMIVFCPGSLGEPQGEKPSFGMLTVRNNGVLPSLSELPW